MPPGCSARLHALPRPVQSLRVGVVIGSGTRRSVPAAMGEKSRPNEKTAQLGPTTVNSGRLSSHQSRAACGGGDLRASLCGAGPYQSDTIHTTSVQDEQTKMSRPVNLGGSVPTKAARHVAADLRASLCRAGPYQSDTIHTTSVQDEETKTE